MSVTARIANGRTDLVIPYLSQGGSALDTDPDGNSLLAWCSYYGDVTAVRLLLDAGAPPAGLGANLGLNAAAYHGHWQLTAFLLESGADPNFGDPDTGETALHAATCHPRRAVFELVVEVLLGEGADVTLATIPDRDSGSYMRDVRTSGETPLHRAAAFGSEAMIRSLLLAGANCQARDARGDSPLSWASKHQRPDRILRLLLYGAHSIHPARDSESDHGLGTSAMERYLMGKPLREG